MAKYDDMNMSGEEFFLRPHENNPKASKSGAKPEADTRAGAASPQRDGVDIQRDEGFEASVNRFSSKDAVPSKRRGRKKRKLGVNGFIRMVAVCVCIGIFAFSLFKICERMNDLSAAKRAYDRINDFGDDCVVSHPRQVRRVATSLDLLSYLGSGGGGIETLDTETQNYYDEIRETVLEIQADYPDCVGFIIVSGTKISYPVMKSDNEDFYLTHLYTGEPSKAGAIYMDSRLSDNFDANMNTVIYGHCMTNGTMFRGIKLFFDSEYRYSRAQEMEITIVTADGVYIYEYFSGYRSEGNYFVSRFENDGQNTAYYNFLKNIRALNTIYKDTSYNANSRIVTLVTCTNLASKPDERYVLHGILKNHFTF